VSKGVLLKRSRQVPAEETPAFAGIAERFRRAGDLDRAITLCRDGLQRFPMQLSARVTLGWALLDKGEYELARTELEQVLRRAPDNLAAIRGLAELHDRAENAALSADHDRNWQQEHEAAAAAAPPAAQGHPAEEPLPPGPAARDETAAAVPAGDDGVRPEPAAAPPNQSVFELLTTSGEVRAVMPVERGADPSGAAAAETMVAPIEAFETGPVRSELPVPEVPSGSAVETAPAELIIESARAASPDDRLIDVAASAPAAKAAAGEPDEAELLALEAALDRELDAAALPILTSSAPAPAVEAAPLMLSVDALDPEQPASPDFGAVPASWDPPEGTPTIELTSDSASLETLAAEIIRETPAFRLEPPPALVSVPAPAPPALSRLAPEPSLVPSPGAMTRDAGRAAVPAMAAVIPLEARRNAKREATLAALERLLRKVEVRRAELRTGSVA
jgi:hypothetical protein